MHMNSRRCLLGLVLLVLCFVCHTSDWIFASRLDGAFQSRVITIMALWAAVQRICVVHVLFFFYVGRPTNDANKSLASRVSRTVWTSRGRKRTSCRSEINPRGLEMCLRLKQRCVVLFFLFFYSHFEIRRFKIRLVTEGEQRSPQRPRLARQGTA